MEERELLQDLLSKDAELRKTATQALWNIWFSLAGKKLNLEFVKGLNK